MGGAVRPAAECIGYRYTIYLITVQSRRRHFGDWRVIFCFVGHDVDDVKDLDDH